MELSKVEKALIYGLSLTTLSKEEVLKISDVLDTEEEQIEMIRYLKNHPQATPEEVKGEMWKIIIEHKKQKDLLSKNH